MHVSVLRQPYFISEITIFKVFGFFKSKHGGERPETCISVRLRTWNSHLCMSQVFSYHIFYLRIWNARLCMSQVLPHHILIKNQLLLKLVVFIQKWQGKTWDIHQRAFQGLKRTFLHVAGLPLPYFDLKTNL